MQNIYKYELGKGSKAHILFSYFTFCLMWWRTIFCQIAYLLASKKKKELVISDLGDYNNIIKSLIFGKHSRNLFYHRMGRLSALYSWILPGDSSITLPFHCKIGANCHFVHNRNSHLNATAIGSGFICYPGVVIGAKNLKDKSTPTIGNNVTIGTGSVVVGNINIGDNVQIAANSFVNRSIPANCIIMGNPAKIVKKDGISVNIPL